MGYTKIGNCCAYRSIHRYLDMTISARYWLFPLCRSEAPPHIKHLGMERSYTNMEATLAPDGDTGKRLLQSRNATPRLSILKTRVAVTRLNRCTGHMECLVSHWVMKLSRYSRHGLSSFLLVDCNGEKRKTTAPSDPLSKACIDSIRRRVNWTILVLHISPNVSPGYDGVQVAKHVEAIASTATRHNYHQQKAMHINFYPTLSLQ